MTRLTRGALCAALLAAVPLLAPAAAITGNTTTVELSSAPDLAALGIAVQPVGIGALEAGTPFPSAVFPITGGTVDDVSGAAIIEHDGSGLSLSVGTDTLLLLNFVIDTAAAGISGDAVLVDDVAGTLGATALNDIELFTLDAGLNVFLTGTAAGALSGLFGAPDLTGFQIGTATVDLAVVPIPPAALMLGSALGLLVARRRGA